MGRKRTDAQQQIAELLQTARKSLQLSVAFLSRLDGTTQHLEVVEGTRSHEMIFREGIRRKQSTSFCQAMLDGAVPSVMPDVSDFPAARKLPAARIPRIRSFVTVPVTLSDGSLYGTFCAAGLRSDRELSKRDEALMRVLAGAAAVILEPEVREQTRIAEVHGRLMPIIEGGGPVIVVQPIVELATGHRVGAEALSRFPGEWGKPPDACFAEAHSVDLGHVLEILALDGAARLLDRVEGYVTMNVSPSTLMTQECRALISDLPHDRVVLELSEHDPVEDYDALRRTLDPLRASGLRLAIDDVGAGFSSLRHIVLTAPDLIKLDRSLVTGLGDDPVLQTLVRSLVDFGHGSNAKVVAEGVETQQDAEHLRRLEVDFGQGWYHGRPGPPEALAPLALPLPRPGAHDDMSSCNTSQRHS